MSRALEAQPALRGTLLDTPGVIAEFAAPPHVTNRLDAIGADLVAPWRRPISGRTIIKCTLRSGKHPDVTMPRSLQDLSDAIEHHHDWCRFPAEAPVLGFLGEGDVFFVGDQPSTSSWRPTNRGRRIFYDGLVEAGLANAHLTDLVKRRGPAGQLEGGLPDDFAVHLAFFREELTLLRPRRVVALGKRCERLLREYVPEVAPILGYVHHFAYAARPHVDLDYPQLLAGAAAGRRLTHTGRNSRRPRPLAARTVETDGLLRAVESAPRHIRPLDWTLRRDNRAHHHGVVTWRGTPVVLQLSWCPFKGATPTPVGTFALHLPKLLDAGCIRYEPDSVVGDRYRVRVVMREDDTFALQVRTGSPLCRLT